MHIDAVFGPFDLRVGGEDRWRAGVDNTVVKENNKTSRIVGYFGTRTMGEEIFQWVGNESFQADITYHQETGRGDS